MKLINPGILKNRNEYETARHRYEVRIKQEIRCEKKKAEKHKEPAKQA